jgi:hypothetical protein
VCSDVHCGRCTPGQIREVSISLFADSGGKISVALRPTEGCMSMRVFLAAAMIALLAGSAYGQSDSQLRGQTPGPPPKPPKSQQEIEADRAAERAYKNSLGNIPDKGATDPWGNVRAEPSKPTPKAAVKSSAVKPQTKTGGTAN